MSAAIDYRASACYQAGKMLSLDEARERRQRNDPVHSFLARVYALCAQDKPRHALEQIFDQIDDWLLEEKFELVRQAFQLVDLEKLAPTCILGFLSVTVPYREHSIIKELRSAFLPKAKEELQKKLQDEARVTTLLQEHHD
jgi:hypothetical protein